MQPYLLHSHAERKLKKSYRIKTFDCSVCSWLHSEGRDYPGGGGGVLVVVLEPKLRPTEAHILVLFTCFDSFSDRDELTGILQVFSPEESLC